VLDTLPGMAYTDNVPLDMKERDVEIQVCAVGEPAKGIGNPEHMTIQTVTLGRDAAFIMIPGEPYIEIALLIKERSPFPHTGLVCLANDFVGTDGEPRHHTDYFALRESYERHEYEATYTRPDFTFDTTDRLIDAALDMIRS
jgi:hypothetical protein